MTSEAGSTHEPLKPPATVREFEEALRALGYSNRQAKAIAREGFRPAVPEPDPDEAAFVQLCEAISKSLAER